MLGTRHLGGIWGIYCQGCTRVGPAPQGTRTHGRWLARGFRERAAWGCSSRVVHVLPARSDQSTNAGHWPSRLIPGGGEGEEIQRASRGAGVKQQGSGQCQLAKPGRMKHPGIRGSRYQAHVPCQRAYVCHSKSPRERRTGAAVAHLSRAGMAYAPSRSIENYFP